MIAAFYVSVVGAPCTALPAEYAATSTGVDCFFIHASRSFFFSVMISPMPMVLNPLSFFIKSLVVVCACKSRQVGSFFGVKFWRKFFDKKNVSFFSSVPAQMTEDPQNTRVWLHDNDDDDAHGTMEREKHPKAHHHAWSRRDHDNNDNNDNNARSRCDFVVDIFLVFTKPMCLFFVVSLFASRVVFSPLC